MNLAHCPCSEFGFRNSQSKCFWEGDKVPTCVISQPRFFPGLHYLHRMMVADVFVIFDSVQFNPRHEENRAKLKTPRGGEWLTVPTRRTSREQLIRVPCVDNRQG